MLLNLSTEKSILDIYLSAAEKNMFVVEKFLNSLIKDKIMENISFQQIWWYMISIYL
jgi:hypothetical protein